MRSFTKFVLCSALLAACPARSAAQRPGGRVVVNPPRPAPRPSWSIVTQQFTEDGLTTTLVSLDPVPVQPDARTGGAASFAGSFSYDGRPGSPLRFFSLLLFSQTQQCNFGASPTLTLYIDGNALALAPQPQGTQPPVDGVAWVSAETESGGCRESLGATLSRPTVLRLAQARTLRARVGESIYNFPDAALAALRDLAGHVPPNRANFD